MKSTFALSLLATIAFHKVAFAQEDGADQQVDAATYPPALPTANTDIYWWKTVVPSDEISNYLTGPATEAATVTEASATDATAATATQDTLTAANATPTSNESTLSAAASDATPSDSSALASASDSLVSAASEASSSISTTLSGVSTTPSSVVGVLSTSSASFAAMPTIIGSSSNSIFPRPSGSIIPPVTTTSSIQPSNSGSLVMADLGKILISVTIAAVLGNLFN